MSKIYGWIMIKLLLCKYFDGGLLWKRDWKGNIAEIIY